MSEISRTQQNICRDFVLFDYLQKTCDGVVFGLLLTSTDAQMGRSLMVFRQFRVSMQIARDCNREPFACHSSPSTPSLPQEFRRVEVQATHILPNPATRFRRRTMSDSANLSPSVRAITASVCRPGIQLLP